AVALVVAAIGLAVVPRADVGDGADTSAMQRLLIWQDALRSVTGVRLAVGNGPETQMAALEAGYPVDLSQRFPNARFDRAHNLVLDQLVTTGLLGTAALLLLLGAVGRVGLLQAGRTDETATSVVSRRYLDAGLL